MVKHILRLSQKYPITTIGITLLITLLFGWAASGISMESDILKLLPANEESLKTMQEALGDRETDDMLIIRMEPDAPWTCESLNAFSKAIDKVTAIQGVSEPMSPFSIWGFTSLRGSLFVQKMRQTKAPFSTETEVQEFLDKLYENPLASDLLTEKDSRALIAMFPMGTVESSKLFFSEFNSAVAPLEKYGHAATSSTAQFSARTEEILEKDFTTLLIFCALAILVINYLGFRSFRSLILPSILVIFGTIWCLGSMRLLGFSLNVFSIIIPPLVLTLGSSYSIHLLNQFYFHQPQDLYDRPCLSETMEPVTRTILLASATTIIGLLSLLFTSMTQTRQFGIAASLGILFCAILSTTFFPAFLKLTGSSSKHHKKDNPRKGPLNSLLKFLSKFIPKHKWLFTIILVCFSLLLIVAMPKITYRSDYVAYFPSDEPLVKDLNILNDRSGGFQPLGITLTLTEDTEKNLLSPEILSQIRKTQVELLKQPAVTKAMSFTNVVDAAHLALGQDPDDGYESKTILFLTRLMRIQARQSDGFPLTLYSQDYRSMMINLRLAKPGQLTIQDKELKVIVDEMQRTLDRELEGTPIKAQIWGSSFSFMNLSETFRSNQARSTLISVVMIFGVAMLVFRSLKFGFYTLVPIIFALFSNFILMGLGNIPMDMTTLMVSSVAVGVSVDDALHLLLRYREVLKTETNAEKALEETILSTGRPIILTTISVVGGLLILLSATFQPIIYFGILVASTLMAALIGTLIFLPAIMSIFERPKKVNSKDVTSDLVDHCSRR